MSEYYKNTEGLRQLLDRGLERDSPYRAYIVMPGFWLDPDAVSWQVSKVDRRFGATHTESEVRERALFRVLTGGRPPKSTLASRPSRWVFWSAVAVVTVVLVLALLAVSGHAQSSPGGASPGPLPSKALNAPSKVSLQRKKALAAKFTAAYAELQKKLQREMDEFNGLAQREQRGEWCEPGYAVDELVEACLLLPVQTSAKEESKPAPASKPDVAPTGKEGAVAPNGEGTPEK